VQRRSWTSGECAEAGHDGVDGAPLQRAEGVNDNALTTAQLFGQGEEVPVGEAEEGLGGRPGTCSRLPPRSRMLSVVCPRMTGRCKRRARPAMHEVKKKYVWTPSSAPTSTALPQKKSGRRAAGEEVAERRV
jgi:hypothetical protein